MTATATIPTANFKSVPPARGKQVAHGLQAVTPSSRGERAESAEPGPRSSFKDVLGEAIEPNEAGASAPAAEAGDDANVRGQAEDQRGNDATAQTEGAPSGDIKSTNASGAETTPHELPEPDGEAAASSIEVPVVDSEPVVTEVTTVAPVAAGVQGASEAEQNGNALSVPAEQSLKPVVKSPQSKRARDPLGLINQTGPKSEATGPSSAEKPPAASDAPVRASSDAEAPVNEGAHSEQHQQANGEAAAPQAVAKTPATTSEHGKAPHVRDAHRETSPVAHGLAAVPREPATDAQPRTPDLLLGLDSGTWRTAGTATARAGAGLILQSHDNAAGTNAANAESLSAQAARGLAAAFKQNGGTVTLHLTPESLGQMKVSISVENSRVTAIIQASTEQAKQMLESSSDTLRTALESKGLSVDRVQITHASQSHGELRESTRGSGADDSSRQSGGHPGNGAGQSGSPEDQRQSGDGGQRQPWHARHSNDIFNLFAEQDAASGEAISEVGAPIAMAESAGASRVRQGIIRLGVDATA